MATNKVFNSPAFLEHNNTFYVFFSDDSGILYAVDTDGNALDGWPVDAGAVITKSVAFGDLDGDGESEWVCEAGPLDSEGSDDECHLWLEEGNWTAEEFVVEIWNNGSEFWKSISISVNLHDDEQGEDGDEHDHSEGDHQHGEEADGDLESLLLSAAVLCFGAAALIWISRNIKGGEEE